MTFKVTYRAKDGALREERVDAVNRAECVAEGGKSKGRDGARPSHVAHPSAQSPSAPPPNARIHR